MYLMPFQRSFLHRTLQRRLGRSLFSSDTSNKGKWYNFVKDVKETDSRGDVSLNVFGEFAEDYDTARPFYPKEMWDKLMQDAGEGANRAVDIAAGTGRGCLELARRNFDATAIDLDQGMLNQ